MGIYDRDYYRGEARGVSWFSGPAPVCRWIIIVNIAIYLAVYFGLIPRSFVDEWLIASSQGIFKDGRVWELLTAAFLHEKLFHILGNMLFLWVVGREVEAMYGSRDFLIFYLMAAIVSTLGWAICNEFRGTHNGMLGASGAIFAAVVVYTLIYPRREILFMFVIPVQIWIIVVAILVFNALMILQGVRWDVAGESHLTGAAFGFLFKHFDLRWSRLVSTRYRRPRLRVISPEPREKSVARPAGPTWSPNLASQSKPTVTAIHPEEWLDAKLDEVLAKIAREGRGGLTEEENKILLEASIRARNKRSEQL